MSLTSHMAGRIEELAAIWRKTLATLPDGQLRVKRRDLGNNPTGAYHLVAELLDAEIERRRQERPGELAL